MGRDRQGSEEEGSRFQDVQETAVEGRIRQMSGDTYREILALLKRLNDARIAHRMGQSRDDALLIEVDVPGERWEIEFVDYDDEVHVEIERFRSNGRIYDQSEIEELFARFSADSPEPMP